MWPEFACSANQRPKSTVKKKAHKPLRTSWIPQKMCLPCLIIVQSCYFHYRINKPFACSRCLICVSCSVHVISTYYARKGSWAFLYLNYPQINEGGKSDHMGVGHLSLSGGHNNCLYLDSESRQWHDNELGISCTASNAIDDFTDIEPRVTLGGVVYR